MNFKCRAVLLSAFAIALTQVVSMKIKTSSMSLMQTLHKHTGRNPSNISDVCHRNATTCQGCLSSSYLLAYQAFDVDICSFLAQIVYKKSVVDGAVIFKHVWVDRTRHLRHASVRSRGNFLTVVRCSNRVDSLTT